jgi:dipeptidase E
MTAPRLLLLSNSTNFGEAYLAHAREEIRRFLGPVDTVAFVPWAGVSLSWDDYARKVGEALSPVGIRVVSVHETADPCGAVAEATAIAVGGGNTFQLLRHMQETGLLEVVRERVRAGLPYIGWSAGSNLACPTILTTYDMPIVEPRHLTPLGLVPFQINAHFTEAVLPRHQGETREDRLREFLHANPGATVIGLREGTMLRVEGTAMQLIGPHAARLLTQDGPPRDLAPGDPLDTLLALPTQTPGARPG